MRRLFGTAQVSPCLCLGRKSLYCLLHKRDKAGWTRGQDEAISRYGSHDVTLVGDVERIECRLERIKADWTQDEKTALRLVRIGYVEHQPIVVPLKIVEIDQAFEELSRWEIRHSPANPPLHAGADIDFDIQVVAEFLQCGREVLIQNCVTIRRRWQRQGSAEHLDDA
ncbi:hypothetical protein XH97_05610 [Bradyrhizobium sp. CCBAU 53380]|nr:hypothetical protein [Bradyrhizobium sp. CCBAU 53380]